MNTATAFKYKRPAIIQNYPLQQAFIDTPERYTIVEASTKAGKTTGCIVWLFEQAYYGKSGENFWWLAPVFSQAKIAYRRLCRYIPDKEIYTASKGDMTIQLANGATIYFKSADNADGLYGEDVKAAVIDEATRMHEDAWFAMRSTLTKTNGRVKIIGNVKGADNWVYRLARMAEAGMLPDWKYFRLTADDAIKAGVLKQAEIEDAERTLPKGVFLELYYGIPNQNSSTKFCYAFDDRRHIAKCTINKYMPVHLSFDFNRNPICCTVLQHYANTIFVTHCLKLQNSNIYNLCRLIKTKFPGAHFIVTGDATGSSSSAMVEDNLNYYRIIQAQLGLTGNRFMVPRINPPLEKNQVLLNSLLEHYNIRIDPDNASALIYDLKFVQAAPNGKIIKADRTDPHQQSDALDSFRYWCNVFMKWFVGP